MTISNTPPQHLMSQATVDRMREMEGAVVAEEDVPQQVSDIASSMADLVEDQDGYRYRTENIAGIKKKVRFKSLSTGDYKRIENADGTRDLDMLVRVAVCDENGHSYLTEQDILDFKDSEKFDARTYIHIQAIAIEHCLGGSLEALAEIALKK